MSQNSDNHASLFPFHRLLPILVAAFVLAAWATWRAPVLHLQAKRAGVKPSVLSTALGTLLPDSALISVRVDDVVEHFPGNMDAILVVDEAGKFVLPIFVDPREGDAVRRALGGGFRKGSLPHEFLTEVVESFGGRVERVELRAEDGLVLKAAVVLGLGGAGKRQQTVLDARPGDALALALLAQVPVLASQESLEAQGIPRDHPSVRTMAEDLPSPLPEPESL